LLYIVGGVYIVLITTKKIKHAWRTLEFYGLIIYGPQGIGKTTYMLKVMYEIYRDWDKVFQYLVFSFDDLIDVMRQARERRIKVIGWDDAGIHGHKYMYFFEKQAVMLISAWIDVVRTRIAGWLITTPNPSSLIKPVRESPGFNYGKVMYTHGSGTSRLVKVYAKHWYPGGRIIARKLYYDYFHARLPDDVYKEYMEMRERFYEEAERNLLKNIELKEKQFRSSPPTE